MMTRQKLFYLALALLALLPACSSDKAPQGINAGVKPGESIIQSFPNQDVLRFRSKITFDRARAVATAAGLSPSIVQDTVPARFVDVIALDAVTNAEIQAAPCATAADGTFELLVPRGATFKVAALASTLNSGGRANLQLRDQLTQARFAFTLTSAQLGSTFAFEKRFGAVDVELATIPLAPLSTPPAVTDRPAGAFCILDACVTVIEEVRAALGVSPPLLTILWSADGTTGSFFDPSDPTFGPALFIKGGDAKFDDIDDLDPSVIMHEFGHFLAFSLLRDSSLGGRHGVRDTVYPSLAFSEGYANALAGMIQNQAAYVDASFPLSTFPDFFLVNLEDRFSSIGAGRIINNRGIRSEITVGELAWDLVDGTDGRVDSDGDGVGVAFGPYLRGLAALRSRQLYVSVEDAFQALIDTGAVAQASLVGLLSAPVNQGITFPPTGTDVFPTRLAVPDLRLDTVQTRGRIDAQNTALDVSNRFFQFTLAAPTSVTVRMTLLNAVTGLGVDSENVDMFVRNLDNTLATDTGGAVLTAQPGPDGALVESTGARTLAAGTYVVEIRGRPTDANGRLSNRFGGTNINYQLEVF